MFFVYRVFILCSVVLLFVARPERILSRNLCQFLVLETSGPVISGFRACHVQYNEIRYSTSSSLYTRFVRTVFLIDQSKLFITLLLRPCFKNIETTISFNVISIIRIVKTENASFDDNFATFPVL